MQKVFEQLTDVELLNLTQEEIDWYIKLKKAEAGIRIVLSPETPTYREIPKPDKTLFKVVGYGFEERKDAEEIASLINSKIVKSFSIDYNWRLDSKQQFAKPYDGTLVNVQVETVFSEGVYNSIKDILASNKKIEEAYKELKNEYDEQDEKSQGIIDQIYNLISAARERKVQFENYIERIKEYLRLANGDATIAWNFFEKAYTIEPSVKNKILESEIYQSELTGYIK